MFKELNSKYFRKWMKFVVITTLYSYMYTHLVHTARYVYPPSAYRSSLEEICLFYSGNLLHRWYQNPCNFTHLISENKHYICLLVRVTDRNPLQNMDYNLLLVIFCHPTKFGWPRFKTDEMDSEHTCRQ